MLAATASTKGDRSPGLTSGTGDVDEKGGPASAAAFSPSPGFSASASKVNPVKSGAAAAGTDGSVAASARSIR